jgi:predicted nucleotidyltransferase component of viral defense system
MTKAQKRNFGHSAYTRLLDFSKQNNLDFTFTLQRYAMERLLYRISISPHADDFILKGASLFLVWKGHSFRVTKDADFLAFGFLNEKRLIEIFRQLCSVAESKEDGLIFIPDSVQAQPIREDQQYGGIRVTLLANLHNARIRLQIDVGFGDAITPSPERVTYPSILGYPAAQLRAYTRYTVVAEKFEAMVQLGIANSRMKDFYDIWIMSKMFEFEFDTLRHAVRDTFYRRKTDIPNNLPFAFTDDFFCDAQKQAQWNAFIRKSKPEHAEQDLEKLVKSISGFLMPIIKSLQSGKISHCDWPAGGPWQKQNK